MVWVKGLSRKPEVLAIAERTGRDRRVVACLLMEFWEWADGEAADGFLRGLTLRTLSTACPETDENFWAAVVSVGWLKVVRDGLKIPRFDRWMGWSAKRRLRDSQRKRENRAQTAADIVTDLSQQNRDHRTEEKENRREGGAPPLNPPQKNGQTATAATADEERLERFRVVFGEGAS